VNALRDVLRDETIARQKSPPLCSGQPFRNAALARAGRRELEDALGADVQSWKWSLALSRWCDVLLTFEEAA